MRFQVPKGTRDILPEEAGEWQFVEARFRDTCRNFGYHEIRTPIFEQTELFRRGVGHDTDIVGKEMYTFEDRGGRSLTLRAEGTVPVVRAYVEHNLGGPARRLVKLYYLGPIFRYDRPQKGRFRQHHQAGAEAIGSSDPAVDAEIIELALTWWREIGIPQCVVRLNSVGCPKCWPAFRLVLREALADRVEEMCPDCRRRYETNLRRILDCKNERCRTLTEDTPRMIDHLCDECAGHFRGVQEGLTLVGIPYEIDPRIVRGLDYYTKTAFEITHPSLGAQDALGGGGRYDGLVEECGGPPTPGVGIGMGVERALLVRQQLGHRAPRTDGASVFVASLGPEARREAIKVVSELRHAGITAEMDHKDRGLRGQMRAADSGGFTHCAIIGEDELAQGTVTLRRMNSGEQTVVPRPDLVAAIAGQ
ncbi:MAG: histidine--tRNA ligase [Armatimonadota bacterium]